MNRPNEPLMRAIKSAGSQSALARLLAGVTGRPVTQSHIWNWLNRDLKVPSEFVIPIETVTGVPRHELRRDIYPAEKD